MFVMGSLPKPFSKKSFLDPAGLYMKDKPSGAATPAVDQASLVPTPTPPISATATEVVQAGEDLRRQELMKKNIKRTIFAGDTGGWSGMKSPMKTGNAGQPGSPSAMPGAGALPKG